MCIALCANAKDIKIVQVADLNFDGNTQSKSAFLLSKFINKMNNSDVDMIVFSGDNISNSKKHEFTELCNILKSLEKPYYLALGENDVHKASGIAKEDYMRFLNYHSPYQKTDSSNYVVKLSSDFVVLFVDGATPIVQSKHGYFSEKTLLWLDKMLKKNRRKKVAIFQHFPILSPEKNYEYETIEPEKYMAILNKYDNVVFVASGHFNKDFQIYDENKVEHISTPSFKPYPYVWREFDIKTGRKFSYTTKIVGLEVSAENQTPKDVK